MPRANNKEIGSVTCPGCGAETPVKINAAGCVYFFCAKPIKTDEAGKVLERCYTRMNYGRAASAKMIEELKPTEENNVQHTGHHAEQEERGATEQGSHSQTDREAESGGLQDAGSADKGTVGERPSRQWFE